MVMMVVVVVVVGRRNKLQDETELMRMKECSVRL
jgi:hypothetical protein